MRLTWHAFTLQLAIFRAGIGQAATLVALPFHVLIFLSITRHGDRLDLDTAAVLAPALVGTWALGLAMASEMITNDRFEGVLELVIATPASLYRVLTGRAAAVGLLGAVAFAQAWVVATVLFRADVTIASPGWFLAGALANCWAMCGTMMALAPLFVLGRRAATVVDSLTYPVYVLGGVFVPVAIFPDWLEPLSRLVFLSWSADLLRTAAAGGPSDGQWQRLAAVLLLGAAGLVAGAALTRVVLRRIRHDGRLLAE